MPEASQLVDTILILSRRERVVSWVVGGVVFEHAEGDFEELVKDGDDDGEF